MDITKCILHINPQANFVCWENDFNRVIYEPTHIGKKPTMAECEAAWDEIQAAPEATPPTIDERLSALEMVTVMLAEAADV